MEDEKTPDRPKSKSTVDLVVKKRRRTSQQQQYDSHRVRLGKEISRWKELKRQKSLVKDKDVARFLLDSFVNIVFMHLFHISVKQ